MNYSKNEDWRMTRYAGVRLPDPKTAEPEMPEASQYPSNRKFREAWEQWSGQHYGVKSPSRVRRIEGDGKLHGEIKDDYEAEVISLGPTAAEIDAGLVAQRLQRFANGTASVSERLRAYGIDRRTAEQVTAGMNAVYDMLDQAGK